MAFYRCDRGLGFDTSNSTGTQNDVLRNKKYSNKYTTRYGNIITHKSSNNILLNIYKLDSNLSSHSTNFYHYYDYIIPKNELTKNDIIKNTSIYSINGTRPFVQFDYNEYITLDNFRKYDEDFMINLDNNIPIFANYNITLTRSNKNFDNYPIYIYSNKTHNMIACIHYYELLYSKLHEMSYQYISEILIDIKSSENLNSEYLDYMYKYNYGDELYNPVGHVSIMGSIPPIIYYMYKDDILTLFFQPLNDEEVAKENTSWGIYATFDVLNQISYNSTQQRNYPNLYEYYKTNKPVPPKYYMNSFIFEMNVITGEVITPIIFSKTKNNYGATTTQNYGIANITENYNGLHHFSNEYLLLLSNYHDSCAVSSYNIRDYCKKYTTYSDQVDNMILNNNYLYIFINKDGKYGSGGMGTIVLKFSPLLELIYEYDLVNTSEQYNAYGYHWINQFENTVDIRTNRLVIEDHIFNQTQYEYSKYNLENFELLSKNFKRQYSKNQYHLDNSKKYSNLNLVNIFDTNSIIDYFGHSQNKYYHYYNLNIYSGKFDVALFYIFKLYLLNNYDTSYSGYNINDTNQSYTDYYFN